MLNVFQRRAISNVLRSHALLWRCLLGAGGADAGLYPGASDVLAVAGRSRVCLWERAALCLPYGLFEQVRLLCDASGGIIEHTDYGADVTLTFCCPKAAGWPCRISSSSCPRGR